VLFFRNFSGSRCNLLFERFIITQYKLEKQTIEIFNQLKAVYNEQAPSYNTVAHRGALFINGRESIADDTRSGRPITGVIKTKFEGEIKR
jgi:hypothetical protein